MILIVIELRPMGIRDILDKTFVILRERFWTFQGALFFAFLPSLIILLAGLIIMAVIVFLYASSRPELLFTDSRFWSEIFSSGFGTLGILLLIGFVGLMIIALILGSLLFTYSSIIIFKSGLLGEKCTVKQAFQGVKSKLLWLFLLGILLWLIGMISSLPIMIASLITSFTLSPLAGSIINQLSTIVQLVVGFLFCLAPVVVSLEEVDVIKAIARAFNLMKDHRWRLFGTILAVYLLAYVIMLIILSLLVIPIVLAVAVKQLIVYILAGVFSLLALLFFSIFISYYYGPLTAIYYDLLVRKEGYDLKLQLGLAKPAAINGRPPEGITGE